MKRQKGITLIALVVTIVVLLILAGIALNLVLGDNGIITRSKEAKVTQEEVAEKEQIEMALAGYYAEGEDKGTLNMSKFDEGKITTTDGKQYEVIEDDTIQEDYVIEKDETSGKFIIKIKGEKDDRIYFKFANLGTPDSYPKDEAVIFNEQNFVSKVAELNGVENSVVTAILNGYPEDGFSPDEKITIIYSPSEEEGVDGSVWIFFADFGHTYSAKEKYATYVTANYPGKVYLQEQQ